VKRFNISAVMIFSNKKGFDKYDFVIPENYWNKKTGSILSTLPGEFGFIEKLEAEL